MQYLVAVPASLVLLASAAFGQSPPRDGPPVDYETARFSRIVTAVAIEQPIALDGRLDEEAWQLAEPATDFTQGGRSPRPGYPASQRPKFAFCTTPKTCTSAPSATSRMSPT